MFLEQQHPLNKKTAGILLSGLLSDTLNLQSPTTTEMDKMIVPILSQLAEVSFFTHRNLYLLDYKSK